MNFLYPQMLRNISSQLPTVFLQPLRKLEQIIAIWDQYCPCKQPYILGILFIVVWFWMTVLN